MGAAAYLAWNGQQWTMSNYVAGVSDGSEAPPGVIGEFQRVTFDLSISTRLNESAWDNVPLDTLATLELTPGDWMVGANIGMESVGQPTTYVAAWLGPQANYADPGVWFMIRNVPAQDLAVSMGPIRILNTAMYEVTSQIEIVTAGATSIGPAPMWGDLWARRMR